MKIDGIVEIYDSELRVGTFFIAEGFGKEHKSTIKTIQRYRKDIEDFGDLRSRKSSSTGGRPIIEYLLNEPQATFLGTLFRNNEQVVKFKKKLVKEFFSMKRVFENIRAQHKDIKWIENREKGKVARLESTDEIKEFKTYAIEQGSENADWYYTSLTKMLNGLLFIVDGKFKNLRDMMTPIQLLIVSGGDLVIKKALTDGMKKQIHYKEIYRLAKERVELFAELHGQSEILNQQLKLF
jgi:phage regulator Rha-like protein